MTELSRIFLAASGSGGHLIPALVIAEELKERGHKPIFIGSGRPLEEELINPVDYTLERVVVTGLKGKGVPGLLKFLLSFPRAFIQTWKLFSKHKPRLVIGVGGYASVLPVFVAKLRGVPRTIHEAEYELGMANKFLARFSNQITLAHEETELSGSLQKIVTGQPIRREFRKMLPPKNQEPKRLLILGGSQGANSLDQAADMIALVATQHNIQVRHQCRPENKVAVIDAYQTRGIEASVSPFLHDMRTAYEWSDLIVARAGASTVQEIAASKRPCIFVPFPFAAENHQVKNAMPLVKVGKALLVEEGEDFAKRFSESLRSCLDTQVWRTMASVDLELPSLKAAERIADACEALMV